ncbi:SET domain-containing protein [Rhodofomes roseus]|uniref:SET domain-containing protein n=1 Tax=Rhodofomes roseus TaxID=34475 RepID=A0ABQ8KEV1_9APHY|nr:SET domain-containing protein [Rhodofomes roseus]KAH9836259.1 SET domain-containing protein [Rhodofomes roseus]
MSTEWPIIVQDIPGKGKGVIAARAIVPGELVLLEAPLFTLPSDYDNSAVLAKLAALTESEQRQFLSLTNCHQGRLPPPLGTCKTNALPCGDQSSSYGDRAERVGIFLMGSRFNSSCVQNVNNFWDDALQKISFRALKNIAAEEELCICYTELFATRENRQYKSKLGFGFECVCPACTLPPKEQKASDARRTTVGRLYGEISQCGNQPSLGLRKVKLVIQLLKEEGILECTGAIYYYDGFQFCVSCSDKRNAKQWVRKALEAETLGRGPDTSGAKMYRRYMENPSQHMAFGLLRKQNLAGPDN